MENDIVIHEMTHGITNRMTGGGTGRCLQTTEAGGMGEGWSDAMAEYVSCLVSLFSIPRFPLPFPSLSPLPSAIHILTPSSFPPSPFLLPPLPPPAKHLTNPLPLSYQLDGTNLCKHKRLRSRPIRLEPRPRPPLIPLFDLCNHQPTAIFEFAAAYGGA